jgi:hypothetical protein
MKCAFLKQSTHPPISAFIYQISSEDMMGTLTDLGMVIKGDKEMEQRMSSKIGAL